MKNTSKIPFTPENTDLALPFSVEDFSDSGLGQNISPVGLSKPFDLYPSIGEISQTSDFDLGSALVLDGGLNFNREDLLEDEQSSEFGSGVNINPSESSALPLARAVQESGFDGTISGTVETSWFGNTWVGSDIPTVEDEDNKDVKDGQWAGKDIDDIAVFKNGHNLNNANDVNNPGEFTNVIASIGFQEEDRGIRLYKDKGASAELFAKLVLEEINGGYGISAYGKNLYLLARKAEKESIADTDKTENTGDQFQYVIHLDLDRIHTEDTLLSEGFNYRELQFDVENILNDNNSSLNDNAIKIGTTVVGRIVELDQVKSDPVSEYYSGIASDRNFVYISDPDRVNNKIRVLRKSDLSEITNRTFDTVDEPRKIIATKQLGTEDNIVWAIERDSNDTYFVRGYKRTIGENNNQFSLFKTIKTSNLTDEYDDWKLTDIEVDNDGNLLVTDSQHQQVLQINQSLLGNGIEEETITVSNQGELTPIIGRLNGGWTGDVNAANPKTTSDTARATGSNLFFPSGVAVTKEGEYFVATNGIGHLEFDRNISADIFSSVFLGSKLQNFGLDNRGKLRSEWVVNGLEFTEIADGDPDDPTKVYTQDSLYVINNNLPSEGTGSTHWKHDAWTVNPLLGENDPRFRVKRNYETKLFRTDSGKLFKTTWGDQTFTVYRFPGVTPNTEGKTAIPTMMLGFTNQDILDNNNSALSNSSFWPFTKSNGTGGINPIPKNNSVSLHMWLDHDQDGKFDADEFEAIQDLDGAVSDDAVNTDIAAETKKVKWDKGQITVSDDGSIWITSNNVSTNDGNDTTDGKTYHLYLDGVIDGIPQYSVDNINVFSFQKNKIEINDQLKTGSADIQRVVYESDTNELFVSVKRRRSANFVSQLYKYDDFFGPNSYNPVGNYLKNGLVTLAPSERILNGDSPDHKYPFFTNVASNNSSINNNRPESPFSFDIEGDYAFVAYNLKRQTGDGGLGEEVIGRDSVIAVYDISASPISNSDRFLGTIIPGSDIGYYNTQIDRRSAPNVREKSGEYYIFMEGYYRNAGFYYRWTPA